MLKYWGILCHFKLHLELLRYYVSDVIIKMFELVKEKQLFHL